MAAITSVEVRCPDCGEPFEVDIIPGKPQLSLDGTHVEVPLQHLYAHFCGEKWRCSEPVS